MPCRTAARSGLCRPLGPAAALISASNIVCITAIPAATLIASSPSFATTAMSVNARLISSGSSATRAAWSCVTTRTFLGTVFTAVPLFCGRVDLAVAQHLPQGRHQAGDRHLKFHEDRDNLESSRAIALSPCP